MWVSKPCSFHPLYWVTLKICFYSFVSLIPRIASSYKILVKNCLFVFWDKLQFLLFQLNFGQHIQYIKIHIKIFPESYRYVKYFSFTNCTTCTTCFGGWAISISCKIKLVFLKQNKAKSIWQFKNILDLQHVHMFIFNPQLHVGHRYSGIEYEHVNMLEIQNVWNSSDGKTSSASLIFFKLHFRIGVKLPIGAPVPNGENCVRDETG